MTALVWLRPVKEFLEHNLSWETLFFIALGSLGWFEEEYIQAEEVD
jgi:hypothetical protein